MAHHWFGLTRDHDDFLLVVVEENLGLGVMHGGQLFRGARELSLDIGHIMVGAAGDQNARLLDVAGEKAILGGEDADPRLIEAMKIGLGMSHVRRLMAEGSLDLAPTARRAGEAIGVTIANLVDSSPHRSSSLWDPDLLSAMP